MPRGRKRCTIKRQRSFNVKLRFSQLSVCLPSPLISLSSSLLPAPLSLSHSFTEKLKEGKTDGFQFSAITNGNVESIHVSKFYYFIPPPPPLYLITRMEHFIPPPPFFFLMFVQIHNPIEDNSIDSSNGVLIARDEEYVDAEQLVPTEDDGSAITIDTGIPPH